MSEEKEIIGQECEHYNEGHCLCYSDESQYPHCIKYPNCYFKQNKRLREALEKFSKFDCGDCPVLEIDPETGESEFCESCCNFEINNLAKQALGEQHE